MCAPPLIFGKQRSAALESVTGAAAAGELYPLSAEEEGAELEMYSDEEAAGGGLWSGAGTGTEGEVRPIAPPWQILLSGFTVSAFCFPCPRLLSVCITYSFGRLEGCSFVAFGDACVSLDSYISAPLSLFLRSSCARARCRETETPQIQGATTPKEMPR